MTLKEIIINKFLNDDRKNFSIYHTNFEELSRMYDKVADVARKGEDFKRFLQFENAITFDGKIKFDLTTDYFDKETKKTLVNQKVVFKYPVYNFFYNEYKTAMADIKAKAELTPLPNE